MTMGSMSKASKAINLSEDIFCGFNFTLRGGRATQADYLQVGKGRDVGMDQISKVGKGLVGWKGGMRQDSVRRGSRSCT